MSTMSDAEFFAKLFFVGCIGSIFITAALTAGLTAIGRRLERMHDPFYRKGKSHVKA